MDRIEAMTGQPKGLSIFAYPSRAIEVLRYQWENHRQIERLRPELRQAAKDIANGKPCLLPGQGVYVVLIDGNNPDAIDALRYEKGRKSDQREAIVVPPERLFPLIDFDRLNGINPDIDERTIKRIYKAHPVGLIVPCKEDLTPPKLITNHEIDGKSIPTIMNTWLARYQIFAILWEELLQYPDVLLSGTSANRTGFASPTRFDEAYKYRARFVASAIRDPYEARHFYQGSHDIINLANNPPELVRAVSVDPVRHPREFQKFRDILPDLVVH